MSRMAAALLKFSGMTSLAGMEMSNSSFSALMMDRMSKLSSTRSSMSVVQFS